MIMFFKILFFGSVSVLNTVARKYEHNSDYSNQNTKTIKFITSLYLKKLKALVKLLNTVSVLRGVLKLKLSYIQCETVAKTFLR